MRQYPRAIGLVSRISSSAAAFTLGDMLPLAGPPNSRNA
jgi:hypothetical protein